MEQSIPAGWQEKKLKELCDIQTGKHNANHATPNGKYRFYTCSANYLNCDTYTFSGESVIIPGNGDIGLVFYYNGPFDAYQRTYVVSSTKISMKYLYYHMLAFWRERNKMEQFGVAIPYVRLGNLEEYTVNFPSLS